MQTIKPSKDPSKTINEKKHDRGNGTPDSRREDNVKSDLLGIEGKSTNTPAQDASARSKLHFSSLPRGVSHFFKTKSRPINNDSNMDNQDQTLLGDVQNLDMATASLATEVVQLLHNTSQPVLGGAKDRQKKRVDEAKARGLTWTKIVWADHRKSEFENLLARLISMNAELLVAIPDLQYENPLLRLRGNWPAPTIWRDTESVREDLHELNDAICVANGDITDSDPRMAILLEPSLDTTEWVNGNRLRSGLRTRRQPNFFRLMARSGYNSTVQSPADNQDICLDILATATASRPNPRLEITTGSLTEKLRHAQVQHRATAESRFTEIGEIDYDGSIFNLRHVHGFNLGYEQGLDEVIEEESFTDAARIQLAFNVALGHIHLSEADPERFQRLTKHYRFLHGEHAHSWTEPWLDNGFGSSPQLDDTEYVRRTKHEIREKKVDPAIDLGLLLYQITSGTPLDYETTSESLKHAKRLVQSPLKEISRRSGPITGEIVKACFLEVPYTRTSRDPSWMIIEEVASALDRHVNRFQKQLQSMVDPLRPSEDTLVRSPLPQPNRTTALGEDRKPLEDASVSPAATVQAMPLMTVPSQVTSTLDQGSSKGISSPILQEPNSTELSDLTRQKINGTMKSRVSKQPSLHSDSTQIQELPNVPNLDPSQENKQVEASQLERNLAEGASTSQRVPIPA